MEQLSLKQISAVLNCKIDDEDKIITNISTDTRTITENSLFVALKGENFDGHNFVEKAYELGAVAVISEKEFKGLKNVFVVEDTLKALQDVARYYKSLYSVFTIGITGSVGKTSTKEMIATILSAKSKTLKNEGNLNNQIGLPMTIFRLDSTYKNAVLEMGMGEKGDISNLSRIASPSVGIITNIGVAHIEALKTQENILNAKLEILDYMKQDAPLLLNNDDERLKNVCETAEHQIMTFGIENNADVTAKNIEQTGLGTKFVIEYYGKTIDAYIPVIGKHNVYNALAGFLVGVLADMSPEEIVTAMRNYKNVGMREKLEVKNGIIRIIDCYNASPKSMRAALDVVTSQNTKGRKFCVFGDMLELGDISEQEHIELGKDVARADLDGLFCYGNMAKKIKNGAMMAGMKNVYFYESSKELADHLNRELKENDVVIFKASRGIKLEEVIKQMDEE